MPYPICASQPTPLGNLGLWVLFLLLLGISTRSVALNIAITNDDGVEASTIHALYQVLKREKHRVIVCSETQDNSGKGGAADFFKPIGSLTQDSRAGAIKSGAPGVGLLPGFGDVFYIDGTPVAATLYCLDVAARKAWGNPPDLVISGPNYGNNTGFLNNSSGTVNAALIALNRGIASIAVSTATPSRFKSYTALSASDPEFEVAEIVSRVVTILDTARPNAHASVLPPGLALNINIPSFEAGRAARLPLVVAREGLASVGTPIFVEDLSSDSGARRLGLPEPPLPGVSIDFEHGGGDQNSEQQVLKSGSIAVSVLKGNHETDDRTRRYVAKVLTNPWLRRNN